jgi:prophage antirepressor-like protein
MGLPQIFYYQDREVRTVLKNGEPWFVAKDVCDILEIENVSQAISRLDEDEKNTIILNEGIGNPTKIIVNEFGLYSLVLNGRKKEAKDFKRWVTHEVLPSIRKTGSYTQLNCMEDLIIATATQMKDIRAKAELALETATKAQEKFTELKEVFTHKAGDWRGYINATLNNLAQKTGNYQILRHESYMQLEKAGGCNLMTRRKNMIIMS